MADIVLGFLAIGLMIYLLVAMVRPEKF
ncbi:MAG: K(+)-transporting ATPase subunit F [bacterium]|nr:K(+)-transporting ATPase subunit F [bacterium]